MPLPPTVASSAFSAEDSVALEDRREELVDVAVAAVGKDPTVLARQCLGSGSLVPESRRAQLHFETAATVSKRCAVPSTQPRWRRDPASGVSELRRALQRDARSPKMRTGAAHHERAAKGSAAVRKRLGLSRGALERAAYRRLGRAPRCASTPPRPWRCTLAILVAVERHLFGDPRGIRFGKPEVAWYRFHRIPGRARSQGEWETFRLHGRTWPVRGRGHASLGRPQIVSFRSRGLRHCATAFAPHRSRAGRRTPARAG